MNRSDWSAAACCFTISINVWGDRYDRSKMNAKDLINWALSLHTFTYDNEKNCAQLSYATTVITWCRHKIQQHKYFCVGDITWIRVLCDTYKYRMYYQLPVPNFLCSALDYVQIIFSFNSEIIISAEKREPTFFIENNVSSDSKFLLLCSFLLNRTCSNNRSNFKIATELLHLCNVFIIFWTKL